MTVHERSVGAMGESFHVDHLALFSNVEILNNPAPYGEKDTEYEPEKMPMSIRFKMSRTRCGSSDRLSSLKATLIP